MNTFNRLVASEELVGDMDALNIMWSKSVNSLLVKKTFVILKQKHVP